MSSTSNLEIWVVLGFGFGLVSFFRGFKIYREYRILADTPEIPIRSIAMGLVHIHGKAEGEKQVQSPVTQTPCYFYKVDVEKYERDSKGNGRGAITKRMPWEFRFISRMLQARYSLMRTAPNTI